MTLLIADPPISESIHTFSNGVKVIRLADFLGPSRGTLSTISDPLSIAGTVIVDSQQVAYTGTDPNKTISATTAQDTIRIYYTDLALDNHFNYELYVSVRATGDIDPTKRNSQHTFLQVGSNASKITGYFYDSTFTQRFTGGGDNLAAPKSATNPYYKIVDCGSGIFWGSFTEGSVWWVLRACTGVGGNYVWYLDCAWLVPVNAGGAFGPPYTSNDFRRLLYNSNFDPVYNLRNFSYDTSKDDSPIDWLGPGQYSVMYSIPGYGYVLGDSCFADHQIGELEKTIYDVKATFTTTDWQAGPPSDFTLVVGSHYVPSHRVDSDSFDRTTAAANNVYIGNSDQGRAWETFSSPVGPAGQYIRCNGAELDFHGAAYFNITQSRQWNFPGVGGDFVDDGEMIGAILGAQNESGTGSTTIGHELFNGLYHGIIEAKVKIDQILVAGWQIGLGWFGALSSGGAGSVAATLDMASQGSYGTRTSGPVDCYLTYLPTAGCDRGTYGVTTVPNQIRLAGPLSLTSSFSANTWVRIKLERRWYRFRAKFWFDGDPEPANWQLEGYQPAGYLNSSPFTVYTYPYATSPNKGQTPRSPNVMRPMLFTRFFRPQEDVTGQDMVFGIEPLKLTSTYWDDLTLDYEAYGDIPKDVHVELEKYTGAPSYGSLTIPYQAQRMVINETGLYTFNNDVDGFNVSLWKENGAPDSQAAVIGDLWQKMWRGGPIAVYELVPTK